ncbi:hypothetical protein Tco_1026256 [Tanacetum coccineum]
MKNNVITIHPTTSTSTATKTTDLQHQLFLKTKSNLQDQVDDPEVWDVLKCKFEKSSASSGPYRTDAFRKRDHDDHQEDDALPEGEKRAKRQKISKGSKPARYLYNKDLFFLKYGNSKTMYKINHRRVRANPEEYFSNHRIVEVVRVTTKQQHELDYIEQIIVMRDNDKPDSFSEANFRYLNKNEGGGIYGEMGDEGFVASIACCGLISRRLDKRGDLLEDDIETLRRSEGCIGEVERFTGPNRNRVKVADKEETGEFCGSSEGGPLY